MRRGPTGAMPSAAGCGGFSAPIIVKADGGPCADEAAGLREGADDYIGSHPHVKEDRHPRRFGNYESGDRSEPRRRDHSPGSYRPNRSVRPVPHNDVYRPPGAMTSGGFGRPQNSFNTSPVRRPNEQYGRSERPNFEKTQRANRNDYDYGREAASDRYRVMMGAGAPDPPDHFRRPANPAGGYGAAAGRGAPPPPPYLPQGAYLDGGAHEERLGSDFMRLCHVRSVDWNQVDLPPVLKNFYVESEAVKTRTNEEYAEWLEEHQILLHGDNIPRPCFEFEEPGFPPEVLRMLTGKYDKPTLIQCISWPVALSGQDMVSIARTGSGKTLGFLLPATVHTLKQQHRTPGHGPTVLVLLPTRELAQQACDVARDYCRIVGLSVCAVFGGVPRDQQHYELRRGVDICIATPGRLLAFMHSRVVSMRYCSFLVLDEADRMLEMGFEDQIRAIISQIRPDRQTLMFSATWPVEVRDFAKTFQNAPVFLNVGSLELSANHNIRQHVEVINEKDKSMRLEDLLTELLEQSSQGKVMVFFDTKRKADEMEGRLSLKWNVLCIHGDKTQQARDQVMEEFKKGNGRVLLATDIAARGLDVSNVEAVINFDYPMSTEQYVHRIGRTARHDNKGLAYTFFTPQNSQRAGDLIKILEEAKQEVPDALRDLTYSGHGTYYNN